MPGDLCVGLMLSTVVTEREGTSSCCTEPCSHSNMSDQQGKLSWLRLLYCRIGQARCPSMFSQQCVLASSSSIRCMHHFIMCTSILTSMRVCCPQFKGLFACSKLAVPLILCNYDSFYDGLMNFLSAMVQSGAVGTPELTDIIVASSNHEVLDCLASFYKLPRTGHGTKLTLHRASSLIKRDSQQDSPHNLSLSRVNSAAT